MKYESDMKVLIIDFQLNRWLSLEVSLHLKEFLALCWGAISPVPRSGLQIKSS